MTLCSMLTDLQYYLMPFLINVWLLRWKLKFNYLFPEGTVDEEPSSVTGRKDSLSINLEFVKVSLSRMRRSGGPTFIESFIPAKGGKMDTTLINISGLSSAPGEGIFSVITIDHTDCSWCSFLLYCKVYLVTNQDIWACHLWFWKTLLAILPTFWHQLIS